MKKLRLLLLTSLCLPMLPPTEVRADTFEEVLLYAYDSNPQLKAAKAAHESNTEETNIALAGFLPTLNAAGTYAITREKTAGPIPPATHDENQPLSGQITAKQNLFNGFGDLAKYRIAEATVKGSEQTLFDAEQVIFLSAATSYFDVQRDEALVELQKNNESILTKHLDSYRQKFRVGVVTRTDIDQSVSRLERAKAARIAAEGTLASTKAAYVRVIGKQPRNLQSVDHKKLLDLVPIKLDEAIQRALDANPTLQQQFFAEKAARESVSAAEAGHYPTVDLTAYGSKGYTNYHEDDRPFRDEWYAGVSVNIPLYTGGATQANVRKAKGTAAQNRYAYQNMRRQIAEETTIAYQAYQTSIAQIDSINAQIKAARSALDGVMREAQVGSRTVLDILDAQQELLNAEVSLVEAKRDVNVSAMTLSYTMGNLTKKNLKL